SHSSIDRHTGAIDPCINTAEARDRFRRHAAHRRFISDVRREEGRHAADGLVAFDFVGELLECLMISRCQYDTGATPGRQTSRDKPDAAGRTCDDDDLLFDALEPYLHLVFEVTSLHYGRCASLHRLANARERIMTKGQFRRLLVDG